MLPMTDYILPSTSWFFLIEWQCEVDHFVGTWIGGYNTDTLFWCDMNKPAYQLSSRVVSLLNKYAVTLNWFGIVWYISKNEPFLQLHTFTHGLKEKVSIDCEPWRIWNLLDVKAWTGIGHGSSQDASLQLLPSIKLNLLSSTHPTNWMTSHWLLLQNKMRINYHFKYLKSNPLSVPDQLSTPDNISKQISNSCGLNLCQIIC